MIRFDCEKNATRQPESPSETPLLTLTVPAFKKFQSRSQPGLKIFNRDHDRV